MDTVPPPESYSIAEAKNRLSELIERALAGEDVTIARDGKPVVTLRPVEKPARAVTQADLDWLRARQARFKDMRKIDGTALVRQMRDEGP